MTEHQTESVSDILRLYGPIKATRISTMLVWPPTKTYRVLVALEAAGRAAVTKQRQWAAREAA
jgi:hypothetical protein